MIINGYFLILLIIEKKLANYQIYLYNVLHRLVKQKGDLEMQSILKQALDTFSLGHKEEAWGIAQLDTCLLPDVTKEQWFEFAELAIKRRQQEKTIKLPTNYY